ncbi:sulfatase-like hydrolase/transferase [Puniceicoccales bacterium CK1056]|uniref:Sulfatase-like hydrolase/transferase n=1 Tax=Oceanipulchritudo coccoides TaxID=2706888 RepID=A0A6B2LYQ7_9BACT|nr:sulfatase-like hydrolase/transferase [Oceanipulchritudo coccoides]NDV61543.1 sulfatase-like hydrolase/transferase [Oceanipulchritudo coccoides]
MMNRRDFIQKTGATVLGGMLGGKLVGHPMATDSSFAGSKKNVIFVMTDQWRYHAQGFVKQDPVQTPCLDAFASRSFNFHNAIASTPVCGPNRACWMTGRFHQNHGVMKNEAAHVQADQILVRNFKDAGYSTAYIGKWHLSGKAYPRREPTPDFLKQDFDYWYRTENHTHFRLKYDDNGKMVDNGKAWQPDHEVDKAIEYMKEPRETPFFMVLSFGPPHNGSYPGFGEKRHTPGAYSHRKGGYGYYAPTEFEEPYKDLSEQDIRQNIQPVRVSGGDVPGETESALGAVPGYLGACSAIDADFGRLLAYLKTSGLEDDTIVVFTSDHGEMLGSHGLMTKGVCFEESIRVPLSVYVPGLDGGNEDRLFNSPDVLPTLMGLTGVSCKHTGVDGLDHSDYLKGNCSIAEPELAYIGYANFRGFRTKRYTYVTNLNGQHLGGREVVYCRDTLGRVSDHLLFDLQEDPHQLRPIQRGDAAHTDALINDLHSELRTQLSQRGETLT